MSEFEHLRALRAEARIEEARIAQSEQAALQREEDSRALERSLKDLEARRLGMEVVGLLSRAQIPTLPIWEVRVAGSKMVETMSKSGKLNLRQDVKRYVQAGYGWKVSEGTCQYEVGGFYISRLAIGSDGRMMDYQREEGIPEYMKRGRDPAYYHGIVDPRYQQADLAINTLRSPYFIDGIERLLAGH